MTWEQFLATVLALGATALARLINLWLPPVLDRPTTRSPSSEPIADPPASPVPRSDELEVDPGPTTFQPPPGEAEPPPR